MIIETDESATILDFSKFRDIYNQNYTYFSAETGLLQAHALHTLQWKYSTSKTSTTTNRPDLLLNSKQFCLGITNPTEDDLALLKKHLNVHDLTLRDIREQNTEEKVEIFKNYTFISLKVYLEAGEVIIVFMSMIYLRFVMRYLAGTKSLRILKA